MRRRKAKTDKATVPCRVILVRHTTAEGQGRFQGQNDVALSNAGRQELKALVEKCAAHPVQALYSSDLRRTRETVDALAGRFGLKVELCPELREIHFGEWEGLSWKQVVRRHPQLAQLWLERFPTQPVPGAEPFGAFQRRIAAAMRKLVAANQGKCVLLVTHAGVIRCVLGRAMGLPARNVFRLAQDPGAVNIIDYFPGGAMVRGINV